MPIRISDEYNCCQNLQCLPKKSKYYSSVLFNKSKCSLVNICYFVKEIFFNISFPREVSLRVLSGQHKFVLNRKARRKTTNVLSSDVQIKIIED